MTLPTLLKKVGVDVQLYVSVDGRIVTDEAPAAPNSLPSHASAAVSAVPIRPHTFHGGVDTADLPAEDLPWWIRDPDRKERDIAEMRTRFPSVHVMDEEDLFCYFLSVDTGRGTFDCVFSPRRDGGIPIARVVRPHNLGRNEGRNFRRAPHLYDAGNLCVAGTDDWDANEDGTAVAVAWSAHWLACYTEWRMGGQWPRPGFIPK